MEVAGKILRRSIHTFLQYYHYFTITSALIVLPFSASILLSQALVPSSSSSTSTSSSSSVSSLFSLIYNRLSTLFDAAGFPSSSRFLTTFTIKASETITSSILILPFSFTFFIIAKASIFIALKNHPHNPISDFSHSFSSIISLYKPLLKTHLTNSFLILSANATSFSLLFFAFSIIEGLEISSHYALILFVSACGALIFSVILANALVISNMAMAVSGMEGNGGFVAILKACVLMRGRTPMALFLALPVNLGLAAIEALFQFRVVRAYRVGGGGKAGPCMAIEAIFIAYLYSILLVLDTIVACMFYKSCKEGSWIHDDEDDVIDEDGKFMFRIEFAEEGKNFKELIP